MPLEQARHFSGSDCNNAENGIKGHGFAWNLFANPLTQIIE